MDPKEDLGLKIREQVYRDCPRYGIQDSYTIAELLRFYERENSRGRIRILRRVYDQGFCLPYELALKAVTDSDSSVREWMAREAQSLDYREEQHIEGQGTTSYLHPDRDLTERLKKDPDLFVRAVLRENPVISDFGFWDNKWFDEFGKCTQLERLAMMRNKELNFELVNRILDVDDTKFNLEMDERFQLARACLVNTRVVQNGRRSRTTDFSDGFGWYESGKNSKKIWELVGKWPEDSGIQFFAYKFVQTQDKVKADIYQKSQSTHLKRTILESCLPEDTETIKLGREDSDPTARAIAYRRSRFMDKKEIEDVLRSEKEEWTISGLLENPWVGSIARELCIAIGETK